MPEEHLAVKQLVGRNSVQGETAMDIAHRKEFHEVAELLLKPPTQKIAVHQATEKKSHKKRDKGSGTSSKDSGSRHKDKHKKTKHGHKVHFTTEKGEVKAGKWSPYGCHYYPNLASFPAPNLDSLPPEPLKKGEQYFLDLSGNICKGPVGVGYSCYCAPFFQHVEKKLESNKQELIKHIDMAKTDLQARMANLERRTRGRLLHLSQAMQEKLAAEQAECRERSEQRAFQERMAMEQQEQRTDLVRSEIKSWVEAKMTDFAHRHYCNHNPRDFIQSSLSVHSKISRQNGERKINRSRSEELLSDHSSFLDGKRARWLAASSSANFDQIDERKHLHHAVLPFHGLGTNYNNSHGSKTFLYADNYPCDPDKDFVEPIVLPCPQDYLETDFDAPHVSPDSGLGTWVHYRGDVGNEGTRMQSLRKLFLFGQAAATQRLSLVDRKTRATETATDYALPADARVLPTTDRNRLAYSQEGAINDIRPETTESEFKMSHQFFDTVSNEMEKWYERRLVNIEKRTEEKVTINRDAIEGRIQAIEDQLTKLNESFSLSGGSRSGSSLV